MASSFSDLGIELMATGENAGTWGTKTNTNLQIVEKAIAGYVEQAVTSGGTTQLTITDGDSTESTSVARHAVIKLTGTISGNSIVTVPDSFSISNIFWFVLIPLISTVSFSGLFGFSTIPKEFEVMLMIFKSEVNSVNEKALFVKQVLLTINGLLLSGNLTTFETNDESVMPDK